MSSHNHANRHAVATLNTIESIDATENQATAESTSSMDEAHLEATVREYLARPKAKAEPMTLRGNTDAMLKNMCKGAEALSAPEVAARIRAELPTVQMNDITDASRLALAFNYAAHKLAVLMPAEADYKVDLARGKKVRKQLFRVIATAVEWDIIPKAAWDQLCKGNGRADVAHDIINAVALLDSSKTQLDGKSPVTPQMKRDSQALASRILKNGVVKAAKDPRSADRDQLYAMATERYAMMRRIGSWIWGEEVDAHVPPFRSAPRRAKKSATTTDVAAQETSAAAVATSKPEPIVLTPVPAAPIGQADPKPAPAVSPASTAEPKPLALVHSVEPAPAAVSRARPSPGSSPRSMTHHSRGRP